MFLKKSSPKESKSNIQNVVTLNAYTGKSYLFKGEAFQALPKAKYNTSNFVTSYVRNRDMISTTVALSSSVTEEDIPDILEIKAYEDLSLDQASSYNISWIELENDRDEREFFLFVIELEILDELFLPIKEEIKYLDLIVPAPLLYKTLYKREILRNEGTHCFVYFTKQDAFVTFYRDGQYLYSKSIGYSLEQMYEKYCEITGETVDEKAFYTVIEKEGLKVTDGDYQQNLTKIFLEVFNSINDIVIYTKRAFELESIEHMFIGSVLGPISGLNEYSENYLGLNSEDMNFEYGVESDSWYIDQLHSLMLLTSWDFMEDESSTVNLTLYPRPPAFMNRTSGQFIMSTLMAIVAGLAYPLYFFAGSYVNDAQIYALQGENRELSAETKKFKKILSEKKKKISVLDKAIDKLAKTYKGKTETLTAIYDKKVNYRLKSGMFHTIAEELDKFDVHIDMLYSENDTVWMSLVSSNDRKFTQLIQYISDSRFEEIKQIDIEMIEKDPKSSYYKGLLKVDLK